jgi:predicted DCC family thiol-disulfide oxidoreductase YuxK
MKQQTPIILYDATCRFCEASSRTALKFVPKGAMERLDINDPLLQAKYDITPQQAQREMHVVAGGKVTHGAGAVRQIFIMSPVLWLFAFLWYIPGFSWLSQKLYMWVADHRYLFMGVNTPPEAACDGDSCSLHLGKAKSAKKIYKTDKTS